MNIFVGIQRDWRPVSRFEDWADFRSTFHADDVMVRAPFGWWSAEERWHLRFNTHLHSRVFNKWVPEMGVWHFIGCPAYQISPYSIPVNVKSLWELGINRLVCEGLQYAGWSYHWQILDEVRRDFGMELMVEGIPRTTDQEELPSDIPLFLNITRACRWTFRTDGTERPFAEVANPLHVGIERKSLTDPGNPSITRSFRHTFSSELELYHACVARGWTPWLSVTDEGVQ